MFKRFFFKVVEIVHDKLYNNLHTKIEAKNYYHLQYWSLPELEFEYETFCNKNLSSYARLVISYIILIEK